MKSFVLFTCTPIFLITKLTLYNIPVSHYHLGIDVGSLVSAFVIHLLESIISRLAMSVILIFKLVSEARFVGTPEDRFSRFDAHL